MLHLTPSSRLSFRLDSDHARELMPLAGKELDLDGYTLRVGVPTTYVLKPAATLRSRLVTFKHRMEPEIFLAKAQEELSNLSIKAAPGLIRRSGAKSLEGREELTADRSPFIRRTLRIHDKEVVGFAMEVSGLSADESLRLQETGLGGRRKFGCGIFVPAR
jgi:CRISPR-associated protein Cas6